MGDAIHLAETVVDFSDCQFVTSANDQVHFLCRFVVLRWNASFLEREDDRTENDRFAFRWAETVQYFFALIARKSCFGFLTAFGWTSAVQRPFFLFSDWRLNHLQIVNLLDQCHQDRHERYAMHDGQQVSQAVQRWIEKPIRNTGRSILQKFYRHRYGVRSPAPSLPVTLTHLETLPAKIVLLARNIRSCRYSTRPRPTKMRRTQILPTENRIFVAPEWNRENVPRDFAPVFWILKVSRATVFRQPQPRQTLSRFWFLSNGWIFKPTVLTCCSTSIGWQSTKCGKCVCIQT